MGEKSISFFLYDTTSYRSLFLNFYFPFNFNSNLTPHKNKKPAVLSAAEKMQTRIRRKKHYHQNPHIKNILYVPQEKKGENAQFGDHIFGRKMHAEKGNVKGGERVNFCSKKE